MRKISEKKIIKEINDNCKKLNYNGYYLITVDNKVISISDEEKETPGIHTVIFNDDEYYENGFKIIKKNNHKKELINGITLGSIISGTKCEIEKGKITSSKGEWVFGMNCDKKMINKIINQHQRYNNNLELVEIYNSLELNANDLIDQKQFCLDIGKQIGVNSYLLITNKMIKNFRKDLNLITVFITTFIPNTNIRFCKIETESDICKTISYYPFIDFIK